MDPSFLTFSPSSMRRLTPFLPGAHARHLTRGKEFLLAPVAARLRPLAYLNQQWVISLRPRTRQRPHRLPRLLRASHAVPLVPVSPELLVEALTIPIGSTEPSITPPSGPLLGSAPSPNPAPSIDDSALASAELDFRESVERYSNTDWGSGTAQRARVRLRH